MTPGLFHDLVIFVTNFGDSGLLTMVVMAVGAYLALTRNYRAASVLILAYFLCIGVMGVIKIGFIGCHHLIPSWGIRSPSGHAALSATVYGTLAAIGITYFEGWRRALILVLAFFAVPGIAITRYLMHVHTGPEVALGFGVGCVIVALAYMSLQKAPQKPFHLREMGIACLVPILLLYGRRAPAEEFIVRLTVWLKASFPFCT